MRSPVLFQNVLYPVKQTLEDDRLMLALVYLSGIPKEAAIKGIREDASDPVPMVGVADFGEETTRGEKLRYVLQTRIALGV